MTYFSSLRSRMLLTYIGLIFFGFGGLTLLAGQQIAASIEQSFTDAMRVNALTIANEMVSLLEQVEHGEITDAGIINKLTQLSTTADAQVVIIDTQGKLLYQTGTTINAQNLLTFPEIIDTATYDLRPDDKGNPTYYVAAPYLYEGDGIIGYVRLSALASKPKASIQERWLVLGTIFVAFVVIGLLVSLWLADTLTRPLQTLRHSAQQLGSGDLSHRAPATSMTETEAVATAFNQMATQVEAMVAEQRAFASNASHELRTPITTIRLRTEGLLSDNLDDATATQYIQEIDSEATHMGDLVDDLMLLSRLDARRVEVGDALLDGERVARALVRTMETRATAKQIDLTLISEPNLPPIRANMTHLRVVWRNVLDNALKYTPAGGKVSCDLRQDGDFILFTVTDNGQGIAPEDLPNLTKRFYRADKAHSRQIKGSGLGLALVESVLALYGGRVVVESNGVSQGTITKIWFPIK